VVKKQKYEFAMEFALFYPFIYLNDRALFQMKVSFCNALVVTGSTWLVFKAIENYTFLFGLQGLLSRRIR
jgi:hypothetical protein